jgi:hypothetical protein
MNKYLSIATIDGTELIPIGSGLYPHLASSGAAIVLTAVDSTVNFSVGVTGGIVAMRDNINAALTVASQTNWRDTISVVEIPSASTVGSIAPGVTVNA